MLADLQNVAAKSSKPLAEIVRQARRIDYVWVAAERLAELSPDLGDLEGVGEPVAHEVVAARSDDLGLERQSPQGCGVHDSGAVTLERRPARPLGGLLDETGQVRRVIPHGTSHHRGQ